MPFQVHYINPHTDHIEKRTIDTLKDIKPLLQQNLKIIDVSLLTQPPTQYNLPLYETQHTLNK